MRIAAIRNARAAMRWVIVAALAAAAPLAARAGSISDEVADLGGVLAARITTLGSPARGSDEARELRSLRKAARLASRYRGSDDARDFATLGKAARAVARSGTADAALLAQLAELANTACDDAATAKAEAEDALASVLSASARASIGRTIASADEAAASAKSVIGSDPATALALASQAGRSYAAAVAAARRAVTNGRPPEGFGSATGLGLFVFQNFERRVYVLSDITFSGEIRDTANGSAVVGTLDGKSIREILPILFDNILDRTIPAATRTATGNLVLPGAVFRAINPTISTTNVFAGTITFSFPNGGTLEFPVSIPLPN